LRPQKTTKTSESPVPGQDSNYRPPKDKSEASQLQSTCSVSVLLRLHNSGKKEKIYHSAPRISLFKCDHMPIQNRPYTPLKHRKLPTHIITFNHPAHFIKQWILQKLYFIYKLQHISCLLV